MADDVGDVAGDLSGDLQGGDSPWAHDVPIMPAPPLPEAWARIEPVDVASSVASRSPGAEPEAARPLDPPADPRLDPPVAPASVEPERSVAGGHRSRRSLVAVGAIGIVIAAAIGAQTMGGSGESGGEPDAATIADAAPTTVRAPVTTERSRVPSRPLDTRSSTVADTLPEPPVVWVDAPITLSARVQAMTVPTQIVALETSGILHVIDVPTGVVHSIDIGLTGSTLAVAVADDAIAVSSGSADGSIVVSPGGAVHDVAIPGGAGQVLARRGTNDFAVLPNIWSSNQEPTSLLLTADGTTSEMTSGPVHDYGIWSVQYLPSTGEAIVVDSGGTYAIDPSGTARRVSTGTLLAVGDNHILVRECDEVLTCQYVRIGDDREVVALPDVGGYRIYDSSLSLSPDGTKMSYLDWSAVPVTRRLLDLGSGTSGTVESMEQYNSTVNTAWAADSSGIFVIEAGTLMFYDAATGESTEVAPGADFGRLVAVAARPLSG